MVRDRINAGSLLRQVIIPEILLKFFVNADFVTKSETSPYEDTVKKCSRPHQTTGGISLPSVRSPKKSPDSSGT
jgi:hypothetical protein